MVTRFANNLYLCSRKTLRLPSEALIYQIMKHTLTLLLCLISLTAMAERRSVAQMRSGLTSVMTPERAQRLRPLTLQQLGGTPLERLDNICIMTDAEAGWAVVGRSTDAPSVLAYGDGELRMDELPPAFGYLMEIYNSQLADGSLTASVADVSSTRRVRRRVDYINVSPLLTTAWAQGFPFYNMCPMYENTGARCVTGCVATAMAQVLNFHKLPKTMHGYKTYGYTNKDGHRVNYSFDYANTTFDWANMKDSYSSSTQAQKDAVATLMYACGVGTNMVYHYSESGANPWIGADAINCFMDGIRAEMKEFSEDVMLSELGAGRPIIYSGGSESGGAHCFVIDGCNQSGYYHCNLGWGPGSSGNYLPTNLGNYPKPQSLMRVYPSDEIPTCTPMVDLQGKYAQASHTPATSLQTGQWYVLWNAGRSGSPMSNGIGKDMTNTSLIPSGESTIYNAPQLVRLVSSAGGKYFIQTGLGDYWPDFSQWGGTAGATRNKSNAYTIKPIQPGYYSLRAPSSYVDTNGPGSTLVGWNPQAPTDTVSNSSWKFYPVTILDQPVGPDPKPETLPEFDAAKRYTLRNTGYSQGYLVAVSQDDAHPTLRGVTQDHANGLYPGALYHDEADLENEGAHWRILTESGQQYLQNELTGKYLTHESDQKPYIFTTTKTPIHIAEGAGGTYTFNASTDSKSYLCAATNVENPAAFWEATDAGSVWTVEEAPQPDPLKGVTYTTITSLSELGDPLAAYTLQNTGYSQGYLVATSADDAHPTLRGVTQDHANGLHAGALYHEEADLRSPYSYWQIVLHEGNYYLYNVGAQQFLANEGARSCYVFTSEPKAMRVGLHSNGALWFSSDNDTQSYLCAATHLPNPAAWYTQNDPGSIWLVKRLTAGLDLPTADPFSTTGMDGAPEASPSVRATMYDLQGRAYPAQGHTRGATQQRGLYIMQGRKVVK